MAISRSVKDIARTLIGLAEERRLVPQVLRDLKALYEVFQSDKRLLTALNETTVALPKRQKAVQKALGDSVDPLVVNAVLALQSRKLLRWFSAMRATAQKEARGMGHHEAIVRTVTPLEHSQKTTLTKMLQERFGGTVELEERMDPSLLGGLRVQIGDWTIDASIAGKLERLTHAFYV